MFYNMLRSTVQGYRFTDRELSALNVEPGNWITKFPSDVFFADEIRAKHGDVRFVATIRDPRAVLCSRHETTGNLFKVSWDHVIFGSRPSRFRRRGIRRHPSGHMQHEKGLIDWDAAIRSLDPVIVRYEDLVRDPDGEQDRLGRLLGLTYRGKFSDFHKNHIPERLAYQMNGVRPVDTGRIDAWKDHPERIREQFEACPALHEVMEHWGYA